MIAKGFRPVVWVFMIGVAVLGCYMLNLRVAAERAELARLDRRIIATQQSIRALQTEVGTRSRIPQLQDWNNDVLALAAPVIGQYVQRDVNLARFDTRQPQLADQAEVRLASAETGAAPQVANGPDESRAATPAPQPAVAASPAAIARPEIRRASLLVGAGAPAAPKTRDTVERPRPGPERVIRIAARDEIRPGPREERGAPATRDERRPAPARGAARDERRPAPARPTSRAAAAGRVLADARPSRELRKDGRREPRRSTRD